MDGKTVSATYFMTPDEVNIIRDNKIVEKKALKLPKKITNII